MCEGEDDWGVVELPNRAAEGVNDCNATFDTSVPSSSAITCMFASSSVAMAMDAERVRICISTRACEGIVIAMGELTALDALEGSGVAVGAGEALPRRGVVLFPPVDALLLCRFPLEGEVNEFPLNRESAAC